MADIDFTKASQAVSITGADSTGVETNMVNSSANGDLNVRDISNNSGVNATITVGTSAVEAKVGTSALDNRKELIIQHQGNGKLYYGLSSSVTINNGIEIFKKQTWIDDVGPDTHIWLISDTAGQDVRIVEKA